MKVGTCICLIACLSHAFVSSAQVLSRRIPRSLARPETERSEQLLEPLLPVAEAVEKVKAGDPQGYYALAIHYAKGETVSEDGDKAWWYMQKAADAGYGNAVFACTMLEEPRLSGRLWYMAECPPFSGYTGVDKYKYRYIKDRRDQLHCLTITNEADVARIRAGYERAFKLGVSAATNELARFNCNVSKAQAEAKAKADADAQKAANENLVGSIGDGLKFCKEDADAMKNEFEKMRESLKQELAGVKRRMKAERLEQLLEPLLPFAEAVEKVKMGDPKGYYALAIHYAKGEVIERDPDRANLCMQKAADADYGNAVFVCTMLDEPEGIYRIRDTKNLSRYTGVHSYKRIHRLTITNEADVARIRAGYERAFRLGVSAATNELARFNRKVREAQAEAKAKTDSAAVKIENEKLLESISDELKVCKGDHGKEISGDDKKRVIWEADGRGGFSITFHSGPVSVKLSGSKTECLRCPVTIDVDKDGRIVSVTDARALGL